MKRTFLKIENAVDEILDQKVGILAWLGGFSGIIVLRVFIEFFLASKALPIESIIIEFVHNFLFFAIAITSIWLILSFFLEVNPQKLSKLLFWSLWAILLPPLIDMVKTGGAVFWSFYIIGGLKFILAQFISFMSGLSSGIVYFGTKIIFIFAIFFSAALVFVKTKNFIKTFFTAFLVYFALFAMGAVPSLISFVYYFFDSSEKIGEIQPYQVIQIFASPAPIFGVIFDDLKYAFPYNLEFLLFPLFLFLLTVLFFLFDKQKFIACAKNFRLPQIIYHGGLFLAGVGLGGWFYRENFALNLFSVFAALDLLLCVLLAWTASVAINDLADLKIDNISNPERPLPVGVISEKEYLSVGWVLFFLSLFGAILVSVKFAALLLVYQFLAWAYSAKPYRLKRFLFVATFFSALASLVIFFIGFTLVSGDQNIQGLSWRVILLLLFCYTVSLPIKDFKDIAGDKADGIKTVPTVFGEEKGRLIVASGIFISFISSVFALNEFRLFWWAIFFGSISFLIMTNKKIPVRNLFWWIMGVVVLYGLVLVKIIFL